MADRVQLDFERTFSSQLRVRQWSVSEGPSVDGRPSAHGGVELAWVEHGAVSYRIGQRVLELSPGAVVLVPAGVDHANRFHNAMHGGSLLLGEELLAQVGDAMGPAFRKRVLEPGVVEDGRKLTQLASLIASEARGNDAGVALTVDALSEAVAVAIWRHGDSAPVARSRPDARIRAAMERIHQEHASPLTVEELASTAGMSRFHFSRHFREVTGLSPYQYLLRTRLTAAAALLRRGHHSVTEAALDAGFTDLGRFSRMFKAEFGCTPASLNARRQPPIAASTADRSPSSIRSSPLTSKSGSYFPS